MDEFAPRLQDVLTGKLAGYNEIQVEWGDSSTRCDELRLPALLLWHPGWEATP